MVRLPTDRGSPSDLGLGTARRRIRAGTAAEQSTRCAPEVALPPARCEGASPGSRHQVVPWRLVCQPPVKARSEWVASTARITALDWAVGGACVALGGAV